MVTGRQRLCLRLGVNIDDQLCVRLYFNPFPNSKPYRRHDRSASCRQLVVPRHRLNTFGRRAFALSGPMSWNSLPNSLRESACDDNISHDCFKHSLKTFLFSEY